MIDPKTGKREHVMGELRDWSLKTESQQVTCCLGFGASPDKHSESIGFATSRAVYLGRTQYTVLMYDSTSKDANSKPWNITFYDYNSHTMDPEISKKYGKQECFTL